MKILSVLPGRRGSANPTNIRENKWVFYQLLTGSWFKTNPKQQTCKQSQKKEGWREGKLICKKEMGKGSSKNR